MFLRSNKKFKAEVFLEDTISSDKDDNTLSLIEVLSNNKSEIISIDELLDLKLKLKTVFEQMKKVLKFREKLIIELRFGLNGKTPKTQKDIANMLGISRSYVSRIETKAIKKLNKALQE